jgi:uncharacterized protein
MNPLTPNECRVLGVLIEKAQTTPAQYPLTLNSLVTGSNQKSNRHPVTDLTEDDVLVALDGLRARGFVREVMLTGSRVEKFRHVAREVLGLSTSELVVLTELMLRGPQTVGELRGRATRMHPLESVEVVTNVLDHLMQREEPLVRTVAPAPGSRATRYAQLLCPILPAEPAPESGGSAAPSAAIHAPTARVDPDLAERVARLDAEVGRLTEIVARMSETAPTGP